MTAEIAILNKAAVALAADSTVTIGGSNRGKSYHSANKLFTLSKHEPVGVMIYGLAGLMDVPWETIIKLYRRQLGTGSFATIAGYAADFIRYLESSTAVFFPESLQKQWFAMSVHMYFQKIIFPKVKAAVKAAAGAGKLPLTEIGRIASKVITEHWDSEVSGLKVLGNLSRGFEAEVLRTHKSEVRLASKEAFQTMPISKAATRNLNRIAARAMCGEIFPEPIMSGVVFAGFGTEQIFPEVRSISAQCITSNRLIFTSDDDENHTITHENSAVLIPFAQKDVVDSFVRGIDRRYLKIIDEVMQKLKADYPGIVVQNLGTVDDPTKARITQKLDQDMATLIASLKQRMQEHRDEFHVNPLVAVLSVLPKNELAEVAESLVSLTSLKRKVSHGLETVGGPVDVAVISKGDGFIWIRRKHYFKPEFNPNFARNYLKEKPRENQKTRARS